MSDINDIRRYLATYLPKMSETEDSGDGYYTFLRRFDYTGFACLSEITIEETLESAHLRVYVGGYFKDLPIDNRNQLINEYNAELRFASAYHNGTALILENDVFLSSDVMLPLIVDYLAFLQEHAKELINFIVFHDNENNT